MSFKRSSFRKVPFLLVVVALIIGLTNAVDAQENQPEVAMRVSPAYDGYFKFGEWLPIWVEAENSGASVQAEARVQVANQYGSTTYAVQVELPTGSRKRLPVYVMPNNFTHEMEVQLVSGQTLQRSEKVTVQPQPNIVYLVGLVAPQRGSLSLISNVKLPGQARPVTLVDVPLSDLPERVAGLRSFNLLVFNNVDTGALTSAQKAALEAWVGQGGRLVIGGGVGALQTAAGMPSTLLRFSPSDVVELDDLPGMVEYAGGEALRVPGPFAITTFDADGGWALVEQEDLPLAQEWTLGSGYVDFVALDLATNPFDAWAGTIPFWNRLLAPNGTYPEWVPADMAPQQMRSGSLTYALTNLPTLDMPSIRWLAILLAIYVLLVGPANFLFLRWRGRLHLAWVTTPLFTLVFIAGAFGLAYALRGTDLILNKIAIIESTPDDNANVNSYLGLFSPRQQSYEIEIGGDELLSPLNLEYDPWTGIPNTTTSNAVFFQGKPGYVRDLSVGQWSMQSFRMEGIWNGFGQIKADLQLSAQSLQGTLVNETDQSIIDPVLILGNQFLRLGDLAPGEERPVNMELSTFLGQPFDASISYKLFQEHFERPNSKGPPREIQVKQAILDSLFPWGSWYGPSLGAAVSAAEQPSSSRVVFLGWVEQVPPEVKVSGRNPVQQITALVVQKLPYNLAGEELVSLPPGFIPGSVVELNDASYCGPMGVSAVFLGRQEVVFDFPLPGDIPLGADSQSRLRDIQIQTLVIHLTTDSGSPLGPGMGIYNWLSEEWETLGNVKTGSSLVKVEPGLISAEGLVRLRMDPEGFWVGGCFFLALGLEGRR